MANAQHLLVPIKVQALVIDNLVINKSGVLEINKRYVAGDGKWSPETYNYQRLLKSLGAPGPLPFYGAGRTYEGKPADQLVFPATSSALPKPVHRGVYLHWVMPSGLRRSYKPGSLDFPDLPDQWLIVRFCRRDSALETKAWFVDSGLINPPSDPPAPANMLLASGEKSGDKYIAKYIARRVGKVVPLDQFSTAEFQGERTTITAVGNPQTGSPTFTAFVAENRNILSWRDDLNDLRDQTPETSIPKNTALSYLLLGWYRAEQSGPLAALPARLTDEDVLELLGGAIDPATPRPIKLTGENMLKLLGWSIDTASPPSDLLKRRCLFHGMVAHINYWNPDAYKGTMLGYPGSPSVEGVLRTTPPSFKVGIGNNAEDALVSLVSSEYSGDQGAPNLWKALEAVIYRQPESLVGGWNTAPRDQAVHQSWFSTVEAGKIWSIRPRPGTENAFPADPAGTAAQTTAKPTPEQLALLKQLNQTQLKADAAGRELAALQQDLYARWWKLCEKTRRDQWANVDGEANDCRALIESVSTLRDKHAGLLKDLRTLHEELKKKLPEELELRADAAPRFWTPADPVIVVKDCGLPTKHQFPRSLPCRLPEQIVTAAEVKVEGDTKQFTIAAGVTEIAAAAQKHFEPHSEILTGLLKEASLVEQAIADLATRTLATEKKLTSATDWQKWTKRLVEDMSRDRHSQDQILFGKPGALDVLPHRLAELWVQQPWSPLFLDWQITWFPTKNTGKDFSPVWPLVVGEHDFRLSDKQPVPTEGFTVRGRSLLSPIDGRILEKPIETLRELLKGKTAGAKQGDDNPAFPAAVAEILSRYERVWDETLRKLASAGLMGQTLTGFHQALLRRDVTLPRVTPNPERPWIAKENLKSLEKDVRYKLDMPTEAALVCERLAPPVYLPPNFPFTMVRAGAFQLDELWLVDDFGQWADLLRGTSTGGSFSPVFHPRVRWHEDKFLVAMPPRVVQPLRLNFRFTAAAGPVVESDSDPALSPICGWIFYNPLDQALVLCDKDGHLAGELIITEDQGQFRVNWQSGAGGVVLGEVRNPSLKAFAQALVETRPSSKPRLHDLLKLIDSALGRIRPAAARRDTALFGRPLALVSAVLGLELFGKAWTDPRQPPPKARPSGTGDAALDKLQVRVNLGCSHNTEDGLVGYFQAGVYDRIVAGQLPQEIEPSGYIAHPENDGVRVGFDEPKRLTLLMDPWGSVQAAVGLVPAKAITLAQADLDKALAQMEASFRVGPVLLQADRLALPTPASDKGRWNFSGTLTNNAAAAIVQSDPKYFSDQPVVAAEGRLLLLTTEE
jgi:hypothetical protein